MTPDMSIHQMLDSFIYIAKGSRVIDRKATDWGVAYWLDEMLVRRHVYTLADLKRYFAHRVITSKWKYERRDPFNDWLMHPHRFVCATLPDAMKFADMAARGLIQPRIDIDSIIKTAAARANAARAPKITTPAWVTRHCPPT